MTEALETTQLVRDYIYVDNPRVRSWLSQLMGGLPEQEQSQRGRNWQAGFSQVVALQRSGSEQATETRSLANLQAALLEDHAVAASLLPDVTEIAKKESNWRKAKFRNLFQPGGLVKVAGPTRITAAEEVADLIERFDSFGEESLADTALPILEALYGNHLGIRIFPCGVGIPEKVFSGLFADVDSYIGAERPLLIPRFGSDAADLTCILQVTRLSTQQPRTRTGGSSSIDQIAQQFQNNPNSIDRGALEEMLQVMLKMLEEAGMLEAPKWPSIGVLPIAIYRNVAPLQNFEATEEQLLRD